MYQELKNRITGLRISLNKVAKQITTLNRNVSTLQSNANTNYKRYVALLNQTAGNAPVPTVLENTFDGALTWSRDNTGTYRVESANGEFIIANTIVFINDSRSANTLMRWAESNDPDFLSFYTEIADSATPFDGLMVNMPIEIRVYP